MKAQSTHAPAVARLRYREIQGDLFAKLREPLALVGENGVDFDRIQAAKIAAAQRAREAADLAAKQQTELTPSSLEEIFGKPICVYTRKQALEDGFQVALPVETSREAGIKFPVFLTREVWDQYVEVPEGVRAQDEAGRLWDILWMLRCNLGKGGDCLRFELRVRNDNRSPRRVVLKAQCGPVDADNPEPAITIMLPDQD